MELQKPRRRISPTNHQTDKASTALEMMAPAIKTFLVSAIGEPGAASELFQLFAEMMGSYAVSPSKPERMRKIYLDQLLGLLGVCRCTDRGQNSELERTARFNHYWSDQLCSLALRDLERIERKTGIRFHALIMLQRDYPDSPVEILLEMDRTSISPSSFQELLDEANRAIDDLVDARIAQTISRPDAASLKLEKVELGLLQVD